MWAWMRHLAAQQTTAPELATFLLVITVVCVVTSAIIYAAIMTIAWAVMLRPKHTWWRVIFPNAERLRDHAGEYVLAGLTSVILTMTLAAKDDLVDRVLTTPASAFIDSPALANVFPLGRLPSREELKGPSLRDQVKTLAATDLSGLVQGPLNAGRSEGVHALLVTVAKQVLATPGVTARVATILKLLCFVMMAIYVAWLSNRRIQALSRTEGDAADLQHEVAGRLLVLGVCLALLLANPLGNPSAELLADSAVAAARVAPHKSPLIEEAATLGIQRQSAVLASGTLGQDNAARHNLTELSDSLAALNQRLLALDAALNQRFLTLDASLTKQLQAIAANAASSADVQRLTMRVDTLRQRALLLVVANVGATYAVQGQTTKFSVKGTGIGLHWVPPGRYTVMDQAGNGLPVVLQPGQSLAVTVNRAGR